MGSICKLHACTFEPPIAVITQTRPWFLRDWQLANINTIVTRKPCLTLKNTVTLVTNSVLEQLQEQQGRAQDSNWRRFAARKSYSWNIRLPDGSWASFLTYVQDLDRHLDMTQTSQKWSSLTWRVSQPSKPAGCSSVDLQLCGMRNDWCSTLTRKLNISEYDSLVYKASNAVKCLPLFVVMRRLASCEPRWKPLFFLSGKWELTAQT